jgi:class 3 adenylate cyclase
MSVGEWLKRLGLERYEETFRDNDISPEVLPKLTAADLKDLGITSIGHRRTLLDAIGLLKVAPKLSEPAPTIPAQSDAASGAERRQLTVMFCDLVGSTELSTQ